MNPESLSQTFYHNHSLIPTVPQPNCKFSQSSILYIYKSRYFLPFLAISCHFSPFIATFPSNFLQIAQTFCPYYRSKIMPAFSPLERLDAQKRPADPDRSSRPTRGLLLELLLYPGVC